MSFERTHSIFIQATPEAVYDYVSDLNRHPEWAHEKMTMDAPAGSAPAGAQFSSTVRFMGSVKGSGRVIEAQDSSGLHRWNFLCQPEGEGTRLTYVTERIEAPFYFKLLQAPVFYPAFGRTMMGTGLEKIKAAVESARSPAGA
jgi:hypothetical protein